MDFSFHFIESTIPQAQDTYALQLPVCIDFL